MLVEGDQSFISTYIRYSGMEDALCSHAINLARDRDEGFADLTMRRYSLTGEVNPTIMGAVTQNLGIEFWIKVDTNLDGPYCYPADSILAFDKFGNRDGDYIDGIHFGKRQGRSERFKQKLLEDPKLFLRINRHYRKRQERLHKQKRNFYEEWISAATSNFF